LGLSLHERGPTWPGAGEARAAAEKWVAARVAVRAAVRVEVVRAAVRAAEAMVVVVVVEEGVVAAREGAARVAAGFVVRSHHSQSRMHSKPRGSLRIWSQGLPGQPQPHRRTAHRLPG